jgi:hypothetical protein
MTRHQNSTFTARGRRGLAPVELVLSIPLMMILLALMIIIGTAGSWKLRTQANSRQAAYRSIWPRTGDADPKPDNWWPGSARMAFRNANPDPFQRDPFAQHPVVRGPVIGSPAGGNVLRVIDDTLDMTEGMNEGYAEIDRELPLFRALDYRNRYRRSNQIFADQQWQHAQMRIGNLSRRIPVTYEYDLARWDPAATSRMMMAVNQLLSNPGRQTLFILDRDDELRSWFGPPYQPYSNTRYDRVSVYPPAARGCNLSRCSCSGIDLRIHVDNLLEEIEDVPRDLANLFLQMYQQQLAILDSTMPPPPGAGQMRADLMQKIQQLRDFIATLP